MDHNEAVQQMAVEQYLLRELAPETREAFEEHLFECPECALDLRAGAAFVEVAKGQLPGLAKPEQFPSRPESSDKTSKRDRWLAWWRPAFVAPAFAALLLAFGYQNLFMFPALRAAVDQPRIVPLAPLRGATRGGPRLEFAASRKTGIALALDLSTGPNSWGAGSSGSGAANFGSYAFELFDPDQKVTWQTQAAAPAGSDACDQSVLLAIPGAALRDGLYKVAVSGIGPHGEHTAVETYSFHVHMTD